MLGTSSNNTDKAWSGGIVNDWLYGGGRGEGVITYGSTIALGFDYSEGQATTSMNIGKPTPVSGEWEGLSNKWKEAANITGVKIGGYEPKATASPCPALSSSAWNLTGDVRLPTLIDRVEPTSTVSASTGEKTQTFPANKKKNGGSSIGLNVGCLCMVVAGLVGPGLFL